MVFLQKKIWHQTVSLLREDGSGASLSTLCGLFGYSRQAYNKREDKEGFAEDAIEPIIIEKAREYRKANQWEQRERGTSFSCKNNM